MEGSGLPPLPPPPPPPQEPPYQPGYTTPQQPYQGPPQRSGGLPAWAIVLIVLGILAVLGVGGCAAVAVIVGNEASDTIDKGLRGVQNIDAITDDQANAIELGTTRSRVIDQLGAPLRLNASCITYHVKNGSLGDSWEFCFDGVGLQDRLRTKRKI